MNNFRTFQASVLLGLCGILFFANLGDRDLTSSHEARAAQNAQSMLDDGHWLVPHLLDRNLELQKPPMYYWLVALCGWLFGGVGVWAVRLPASIGASACVLFLFYAGVRSHRPTAGFLSALILATCVHFTWLARVGRIDMPLASAIAISLFAFHVGNLADSTRLRRFAWHFFGYSTLAAAVLLKGPIAIVLSGLVAGSIWMSQAKSRSEFFAWLRETTLWWGLPLMLAIAVPWFVWANERTDNRLWEVFFWYHNVERGLGGADALASHPWWFYAPRIGVDLLPWVLIVPGALFVFVRNETIRNDAAARAGLIWFFSITLFLSCMQFKRADYLLPAYPGLAIFLGVCIEHKMRESEATRRRLAILTGSLVCACVAGWVVYLHSFIPAEERAWPYRAIAREIREQTDGPVIFFRAESHVLMYHLGKPVDTILEWENLAIWAERSFPVYVVMPEACANQLDIHLPGGAFEPMLRTRDFATGKRDRPLIVMRNRAARQRAG